MTRQLLWGSCLACSLTENNVKCARIRFPPPSRQSKCPYFCQSRLHQVIRLLDLTAPGAILDVLLGGHGCGDGCASGGTDFQARSGVCAVAVQVQQLHHRVLAHSRTPGPGHGICNGMQGSGDQGWAVSRQRPFYFTLHPSGSLFSPLMVFLILSSLHCGSFTSRESDSVGFAHAAATVKQIFSPMHSALLHVTWLITL